MKKENHRTTGYFYSGRAVLTIMALSIFFLTTAQKPDHDFVSYLPIEKGFAIVAKNIATPIVLAKDEYSGVIKMTRLFQQDIAKVSGTNPSLSIDTIPQSGSVIIIGTIEKSSLIKKLITSGKLDVNDIKDKWDNSLIQVIDKPFEGIDKALVIVGSNKRGAIYGMFDISRKIGVSPWYWWADVPVQEYKEIFIKNGRYNLNEPKVKYRGIFLNDEEPALGRWAVQNYGGFNHQFYEKVFELMLRLKGNYLWPAMWWASFNSNDTLNPVLANELGIVMGTSHHEPMMRAHAEWKPYGGGEWNFATNAQQLKDFWREGIERMDGHESIITLAMRGDGDLAMSAETNTALLEEIVKTQREIIAAVTNKPAEQTPQLWALYKEVQEYYEKGMRVPEDITLLLCDDNWGNVRKLPKLTDQARLGGYGMYYHFDFVGGPRNYKWLNTSPLPRIWEQMNLCYNYGVAQIWLVNVGDLKPMELPISFFLDYAWDPELIPAEKLDDYTIRWANEQFGNQHAEEIAEILRLYTKYNSRRKPESLNFDTYSLTNYREFERIVTDYNTLAGKAKDLYNNIETQKKDAFYQLVYYPVMACSNLNDLYYSTALNYLYAKQGRSATNDMATRVKELFQKDNEMTTYYHTKLSNGKWDHMMSQIHIGYKMWQQPREATLPELLEIEVPKESKMGVAVEGNDKHWPNEKSMARLPAFDSYNKQSFYVEIFNTGQKPFNFQIKSDKPWVQLSRFRGTVDQQQRIEVSINWEKLKLGSIEAQIEIKSGKNEIVKVQLTAVKLDQQNTMPETFIEQNGYVSIEAQNYSKALNNDDITWLTIPGMGRTLSAVTAAPVTKTIEKTNDKSPVLEYNFYLLENPKEGKIKVNMYLAPTLNFKEGNGLHYAVSIDNEEPQLINMHEGTEIADWKYPRWWNQAVLNNSIIKTSEHLVSGPGKHVLKFWRIDPGVVLEKIVIDCGGLKPSYLGPLESIKIE